MSIIKYACPCCKSPKVQISLPAWHTSDGTLAYIETDAEADILYWYCEACDESGEGEPARRGR